MGLKDALEHIFSFRSLAALLVANIIILMTFVAMAMIAPALMASPGEQTTLMQAFLGYFRIGALTGLSGAVFIALPSLYCFLRKKDAGADDYQKETIFWTLPFAFGLSLVFCLAGPPHLESLKWLILLVVMIFLFLYPFVFVAAQLGSRIYWRIMFHSQISPMPAHLILKYWVLWAFLSFMGMALD